MRNRFFADETLDMLFKPERWRVVCTRFPPEEDPICRISEHEFVASNLHKHAHRELLFVLDGAGEYGACGYVYPCHPGTVFLFDSFEEHQLFYPPDFPDADHLWVYVFEDHLLSHLNHRGEGPSRNNGPWRHLVPVRTGDVDLVSCIFGSHRTIELPLEFHRLEVYSGLSSFILAMIRDGYSVPADEDAASFQNRVISTICDHIQQTAGRGTSLDTLARMSGYSKFHFLRLFKQYTGMPVHQYIDYCRLEKVAEMQRQGYRKKEIADYLGFSSPSAFLRWYKNIQNT